MFAWLNADSALACEVSMTEILIIKPSSLGDIVHALQVATSLKAQCAGLRISWVVREMFAPIVRACEAVDQVYVFERAAGARMQRAMSSLMCALMLDATVGVIPIEEK